MPWGDRTGPMGMGPMTGRAAGFCANCDLPGYMNAGAGNWYGYRQGFGHGYGRGFGAGRGRGWRNRFYATGVPGWDRWGVNPYYGGFVPPPAVIHKEDELKILTQQAAEMKSVLDDIQNRMDELQAPDKKK